MAIATSSETETKTLLDRAEALIPIVEEDLDESERERRLTNRIADKIKDEGLIGVWLPESLGGLESNPREAYELFERLAYVHGSTAWCVWIWSTAGQLAAGLSEEGLEAMFANGVNGSIGAGGIFPFNPAIPVDGGYVVTGRWPYASGSAHAQWLGGGAMVIEDGKPRMTPFGMPAMKFVTFPREKVEIIDTWHVLGLRATSSNDVAVENAFVPEYLASDFGAGSEMGKDFQGPLYRFPVLAALGAPIGIIAAGIATRAVDEFIKLAKGKTVRTSQSLISENTAIQNDVAKAYAAVKSARAWLYEEVDKAWETVLRGDPVSVEQRINIQVAGTNATRSAAYTVDLMHAAAGGTAVYQRSPIERCFRDVHSATQHAGTSPRTLESTGRMLLGMQPDNPMFLQ